MSNEIHENPENEDNRAEKLPWHPIGALEPAGGTDAERIEADGIDQPSSVVGLTNLDDGRATDAQKIDADGLE
ncbi:hypothetical protein [Pengzhenrongella phosphoraccumulans]|uniref:hypothetical protein n=1 Tax=Pengzhenrongella phosphoraccumulans TaxID=3114394 RepID=UPI00388ED03B